MLTIKQITENTDAVLRGLEKKHFKNAQEVISQVIEANDKRLNSQNQLDKNSDLYEKKITTTERLGAAKC